MDALDIGSDVYRRWLKVGQLIPQGNWKIINVGGDPNDDTIKLLIPHETTNINPEFNALDGTKLDYPDNSFDFAISIDTLEHVDEKDREKFVKELVKVAKYKAILACPFDEPYVVEMEKVIYAITQNPFLKEHEEKGLPSLTKILSYIGNYEYNVYPNDSLISWASYILLHQIIKRNNHHTDPKYREFVKLLNTIYNPNDDLKMSYRKVIEVIKVADYDTFSQDPPPTSIPQDTPIVKSTSDSIPAPKVSIVIPTLVIEMLDDCIKSIEENTEYPNYDITIVNDGGTGEELMEYLKNTPHNVVQLKNNVGFSSANNAGFKVVDGDYIMTLNADTLVPKGWLKIMVETLESEPDVGIVYPSQIKMDTNILIGDEWTIASNFPTSTLFVSKNIGKEYDPSKETKFEVQIVPGVCMLMRRDRLFEVGLFNEDYYNGCEDYDLSFKMREKGYKLFHAPVAIQHYAGFVRNRVKGIVNKLFDNKLKFCDMWFKDKFNITKPKDPGEGKYNDDDDIEIDSFEGTEKEKYKIVLDFFTGYGYYRTLEICAKKTGIPLVECRALVSDMYRNRLLGGYVFEKSEKKVHPHKHMYKFIMDKFNGITKDSKILEIGPGNYSIFNPEEYVNWTSVDKFFNKEKNCIEYSHRVTGENIYPEGRIQKGEWENLSELFSENEFDVIVSSHTFEHTAKPIKALKEAFKVLKNGGYIINFMPDGFSNDPNLRLEVTHSIYAVPDLIEEFFEYAGGYVEISIMPFRSWYDVIVIAKKDKDNTDVSKINVVKSVLVQDSTGGKILRELPESLPEPKDIYVSPPDIKKEMNIPIIKEGKGNEVVVVDSTYQDRYVERNEEKLEKIAGFLNFEDRDVLDIGCNVGFFSFNLAKVARLIFALDIDDSVIGTAEKFKQNNIENYKNVMLYKSGIENWDFNCFSPDITLYLSTHHHLINAIGLEKASECLKKISENTTTLVFECGQRGEIGNFEWMNKLPQPFTTYDDIVLYLKNVTGFDVFHKIHEIPIHGINRNIIACERS